ncbi:unnamed protein product [Aphanomyces euteiches]
METSQLHDDLAAVTAELSALKLELLEASNSHKTFDDKTLVLQDDKPLALQDNKTLVLQDNSILDPKDDQQCELVTVDSGVAAMTESTFADAELSIEAAGSTTSKTDKASTVDASP